MAKVSKVRKSVVVTPTITAGAYSAGDALGDEMVIDPKMIYLSERDAYVLQGVTIVDKGSQDDALDLVFFDSSVTPAADNAAADFTDAALAANCIGVVSIAAASYATLADNSVGSTYDIGLPLKVADGGDGKIYCYAVTRGTPTYTSTSDLVFRFDLEVDA